MAKNKPEQKKLERPISIIIVCAIAALGVLLALVRLGLNVARFFQPLEPEDLRNAIMLAVMLFFIIALEVISLVGMWRMQRVAVTAYSLVFFINLIFAISLRSFDPFTLIVPVIVLILMTQFSKHMQ